MFLKEGVSRTVSQMETREPWMWGMIGEAAGRIFVVIQRKITVMHMRRVTLKEREDERPRTYAEGKGGTHGWAAQKG